MNVKSLCLIIPMLIAIFCLETHEEGIIAILGEAFKKKIPINYCRYNNVNYHSYMPRLTIKIPVALILFSFFFITQILHETYSHASINTDLLSFQKKGKIIS